MESFSASVTLSLFVTDRFWSILEFVPLLEQKSKLHISIEIKRRGFMIWSLIALIRLFLLEILLCSRDASVWLVDTSCDQVINSIVEPILIVVHQSQCPIVLLLASRWYFGIAVQFLSIWNDLRDIVPKRSRDNGTCISPLAQSTIVSRASGFLLLSAIGLARALSDIDRNLGKSCDCTLSHVIRINRSLVNWGVEQVDCSIVLVLLGQNLLRNYLLSKRPHLQGSARERVTIIVIINA